MPDQGPDDTVILRRPAAPAPPRRPIWPWLAGGGAALAVAAIGAALWFGGAAPPAAPPSAPAPVAAAEAPLPPLATEAEILAGGGSELVIRRFAPNPAVLVLDFPTLAEQGRMLNRLAALVEKAGLPRDRVLDDTAMARAVQVGGGTAETFYYGHNYRAADIARFFALADRDGIRLNAEEERLRRLLAGLGWLAPGAVGAVVSIPHAGVEPWLDGAARAAMLRHELSHGEFFTSPLYAELVWRFWREMLTAAERDRFRALLATASYDPAEEEVMANEAHAFLFHTPDGRFFTPASAGLAPERVAALRAAFAAALPPGWIRDAMAR
jgi:hypothetical protein